MGPTAFRRRMAEASDAGQTAIVAVLAVTVIISIIGVTLVQTVITSLPLQQTQSVQLYANRAMQAGENAYLTAINANSSLAQCSTNTNSSGLCSGINYGEWNLVNNSTDYGGDAEYYAFGNPVPHFDPTTHTLDYLTVQVIGAAHDVDAPNGYLFDQETITVTPKNGFLQNVWWTNYESYSSTGDYSTCNYNWSTSINYDIDNSNVDCGPVYFGPGDYLFGPVYTNDSVFVSGNGQTSSSPSFGTSTSASPVNTADPNCLFVDNNDGMSGGHGNCANADSDVALYEGQGSSPCQVTSSNACNGTSSYDNPVEKPPATDQQLATIASQGGCLYSGPTQITLSGNQMTVVSPDTPEQTFSGISYPYDTNNVTNGSTGQPLTNSNGQLVNGNDCPNDGTATLPSNGVVFVENATNGQAQKWANPLDDPVDNSVTNLTESPKSPTSGQSVTLTATVTSDSPQLNSGATVSFSQTTTRSGFGGGTSTSTINNCTSQALTTPTQTSAPYTATATCTLTYGSNNTGAFSATFSGGNGASSSSANLGTTYTLTPSTTYGPDSQVTAGGCNSCYYGETSSPDAEGDAFVQGSLSGQLTIGTGNDVIVDGNITYADCQWTTGQSGSSSPSEGFCPYNTSGPNDTLGLIAENYAEIDHPLQPGTSNLLPTCSTGAAAPDCDPSNGNGLTVDAAILALNESFVVNNYADGGTEGDLTVYGSIQQYARGPVGTFNGSSYVSGYDKHYTWDPLLDYLFPPSYLVPSTAAWTLSAVNVGAATEPNQANQGNNQNNTPQFSQGNSAQADNVCPPLVPPYGQTQWITAYCSQSTGGLPNYPAQTVPTPPYDVQATASVNGVVTVTWQDPASSNGSPITSYTVAPSPACSTCLGTTVTSGSATSATITGVTAGSTYRFTVSATNSSGTSSPSIASNAVEIPTVPGAPTIGSAVSNTNGSVTVNWTDPDDNGSAITAYTVVPNPPCSSCTGTSVTGNPTATSSTITGLSGGGTYTFTVTATNAVGTGPASAPSNEVGVPTVPGIPTNVTATSGNTQATVSWTAPSSNGGEAITGYVITPYIGSNAQTATTFNSTATSETVTGLTNGDAYTFKVAAINGVGTGSQSVASNSVTPATVPGAPTIGTATSGNASASVSWTAPVSTGGSPITGYVVTPYIGNTAQTALAQTFNSTATTETVTGLTNGTAYTFTVAAINSVGTGTASAKSNSVTPATVPGAPTIGTATGGNGQATVTWTAPSSNGGEPITGYIVTPYIGGEAQVAQQFNSTNTTETVTGLTNGTSYTFTVAAINSVGEGAQSGSSNAVTPATTPSAPTIDSVTSGNQQVVLTWTAPSSNGGEPITGYVVTPYINGTAQNSTTFNSTATTQTMTGLTNGTAYTFTVAAINSIGTGAASTQSSSITPATLPGAPTGVTAAVASGTGKVTVSWTAPSNGGATINTYTVTPSPACSGCTGTTVTGSPAATSTTISGLTLGTSYTFTVTATNTTANETGTGTSPASAPTSSIPAIEPPQSAPTIGTATSGNGTVTVNWSNDPAATAGAPITGYVITPYIGGTAQTAVDVSGASTTSGNVTGLTNGTAYTFTVAAMNAAGTGPASSQSNSITPATTSSAPTNVTAAVATGTGNIAVSWSAPSSNGGATINTYTVTPSPACSGCTGTTVTGSPPGTSTTISGLTPGTSYTFTVTATNTTTNESGTGTSPASSPSSSVTAIEPPQTAPTIGTVTSGNASVTVNWSAATTSAAAPVTGYVITPYIAGTAQTAITVGNVTSYTVSGLTNGTAYTFTVAPTNAAGTGPASSQSNSVTPATVPGAPTIGTATGGNAQATVSWTAPSSNGGAAITGYVVTPYIGSTAQTAQTFSSTATTETLTGLTNGSTYTFKVAAINSAGTGAQSAASNSVTPATVPGAPTIGTATGGNAQATVTWTGPSSNGGSPITGYVVTPYIGSTAQTATTFSSTATTETVTGLTNGTAYTFTVAAINSVGTGAASAQSNSVTPATTPGAPTIGTATAGNASATVTWTAPSSNGGAAITGYTVTPYIGSTAQTATTFSSTATTETVTGLTNGTAYTFKVAAINSVGTGTQSAASNSVTPATTPGAPTIGTATSGNASASVSWTAPSSNGGAAITGYTVTPYISGTAQTATTFSSTATTETVTGLTNGTTYTFTVAAINSVGTGTASAQSNSVTPATTPGAPTAVSATAGTTGTSATVTWTAPSSNGGAAITGYVVTPYIGSTAQTATTFNSTATSQTVSGLTAGDTYTFEVAAINSVGTGAESAASSSVTLPTAPGAPTIGTATGGNAEATVTWTAPSSNGGESISGYVITPYIGSTAQTAVDVGNVTSDTVTGLTNGDTYTFKVAATNSVGTGSQSAASNSVTPATVPGAPTIGTASKASNTSATVTWTAPSSNGGSAITGYTVTPYISGTAQTATTFSSTATTETVTGLTNGDTYTFKVAAINAVGTGSQSAASNSVNV